MNQGDNMDNHTKYIRVEREHAEIYNAVLDLRNGKLSFSEFVEFAKSFNPDVTVGQLLDALEGQLGGVKQ